MILPDNFLVEFHLQSKESTNVDYVDFRRILFFSNLTVGIRCAQLLYFQIVQNQFYFKRQQWRSLLQWKIERSNALVQAK